MARSLPPCTWKNGFAEPAEIAAWTNEANYMTEDGEKSHYTRPPAEEPLSSTVHNRLGRNTLRTWPTLYDGTESPHGQPRWWKPSTEVDVLICGDKADAPLLAGRADAVQPRALELLHSWGLAQEVHEEGPILNTTTLYKDGRRLVYTPSSQCDSKYRGIHVITQGQIERIYIRDLLRHNTYVERCMVVERFESGDSSQSYPIKAVLKNLKTGQTKQVQAKYLIGADGSGSKIREQLKVPFDGTTTDIYWAIIDCVFKTDYPYIFGFSVLTSAEHGGCIIIPREDGYTRIYTQINGEKARQLARDREVRRNASSLEDTRIDDHGITAEEVLEQTNKILAPYTVEMISPISWFAVWKVSERVARAFSSPDLRVHIGGDAAHVHSVLGAFGLNSSIYDASNLGWKLGLCIKNLAKPSLLLPTYDIERRLFANRVIRCSGAYLRFICSSFLPLPELRGLGEELEIHDEALPALDGSPEAATRFLSVFFSRHNKFLIGMQTPIVPSVICPPMSTSGKQRPTTLVNGARAPNPRVCFETSCTSYLYDKMTGVSRFHIVIFGSDLRGPVRKRIARFSQQALGPGGFFTRFGGPAQFNVVLVVKALPHEKEELFRGSGDERDAVAEDNKIQHLRDVATVVYDDRSPDEDAHYWYGINHARGAVIVVRPDLWVGISVWPEDAVAIDKYFEGFLLQPAIETQSRDGDLAEITGTIVNESSGVNGHTNDKLAAVNGSDGANGHTNEGFALVKESDSVNGHTNGDFPLAKELDGANGHTNGDFSPVKQSDSENGHTNEGFALVKKSDSVNGRTNGDFPLAQEPDGANGHTNGDFSLVKD
ncbi:hypothetical protein MMC29_001618 [Sticta canariensis]|nr:hypothetical protein [Sticta canariensis]